MEGVGPAMASADVVGVGGGGRQQAGILGTPVFPLFALRRPGDSKATPSRRGTLCVVYDIVGDSRT